MKAAFARLYDFARPLDDLWEWICDPGWTTTLAPNCARIVSGLAPDRTADIYLRPCTIPGDTLELGLVPGAVRAGVLRFGFLVGFEYVMFELNFNAGRLTLRTHECHKPQPRLSARIPRSFSNVKLVRERDRLPGFPYEGCQVAVLLDGREAARVRAIDFLPESLAMFGLKGPGEVSLSHFGIRGPTRPRPEYVTVGIWQQRIKPTTPANVDALLNGVRQAAAAGVQILVTPETSLTGLRVGDPEFCDDRSTRAELARLQKGVAAVPGAPYTLVGYPDSVPGREVEGATARTVRVNCHRFVRPDGTLGPPMAKVHSCEEGLWHGRRYNCQRVGGVEVAVGVCHDSRYPDVWAAGVMAGARLCLHPVSAGTPKGRIADLVTRYAGLGGPFDSFWATVNAGGGGAIVYPDRNRKHPNTVLALSGDLTAANPSYPEYAPMTDSLGVARVRLWDATGCYPMRTLRGGSHAYRHWSALMPPVEDAG